MQLSFLNIYYRGNLPAAGLESVMPEFKRQMLGDLRQWIMQYLLHVLGIDGELQVKTADYMARKIYDCGSRTVADDEKDEAISDLSDLVFIVFDLLDLDIDNDDLYDPFETFVNLSYELTCYRMRIHLCDSDNG